MPEVDELMRALDAALRPARWPVSCHAYGRADQQVADLRLPARGTGPFPVVVLLHGGFWRDRYRRDLMAPIAVDVARRGFASWNVEYRRVGSGGGVPATLDDIAAALDALGDLDAPIDRNRVAVVGHSAGGHLALVAARHRLIAAAVAQAGVCDLTAGHRLAIGAGAVDDFMAGPPGERADAYRRADPMRALPLGVLQLLVHGDADPTVPVELSRAYAGRAAALGDACTLIELPGVGHFELIDPRDPSWPATVQWITASLG